MQTSAKPALRRRYLTVRREFNERRGPASGGPLGANLERLLGDLGLGHVALYAARGDEARPEIKGRAYYYPRIRGEHLEFYRPTKAWKVSRLGIREPHPDKSAQLDPTKPAAICCPAVAVDWSGGRLGLGKGYYDRFLNAYPHHVRIGVAYQVQVSKEALPMDRRDAPLDWIVTEQMILRTTNRRTDPWT